MIKKIKNIFYVVFFFAFAGLVINYYFSDKNIKKTNMSRTFYLNSKTNKGIHSFYVKRGRDKLDVRCENFNDAVVKWEVNKIKMDIEGGEYDLLMNFKHWDKIDEIIYEWHRKHLKDFENKKFNELASFIKSKGFKVNHPPVKGNWATVVHVTK